MDPQFWSSFADDYNLMVGSPCIDTGDPLSPTDPDGSRADMGAYPFDSSYIGGPYIYCQAKLNSAGCLPTISWTGSPTMTGADDFFVTAESLVNQKPVIGIWGQSPGSTPFFGGTLCLSNLIVRTPVANSGGSPPAGAPDCTGTTSFHFSQAYASFWFLSPGDHVFAQFWYRDPAHLDGFGVGLTDALEFVLLP